MIYRANFAVRSRFDKPRFSPIAVEATARAQDLAATPGNAI